MAIAGVSIHRYSLRVLPLAIAAITIATSAPVELRPVAWLGREFNAFDFLQNLLLYAPLGAALSLRRWWAIAAAAALLSISTEVFQVWSVGRFTSLWDVGSNVLGALMGARAWRRYASATGGQATVAVNGPWLVVVSATAIAVLAIWSLPTRSATLSNWDSSFALLLGNESTGDRPWRGTLYGLQILRGALSAREVAELNGAHEQVSDHATLYRIQAPMTLKGGRATRAPKIVSQELAAQIADAGAFTVIARIRTHDLVQDGPARIISFSDGTLQRNFDLGQEQDRIVWRVRTPVSGENGEGFRAETTPILKPNADTLVVASYDGSISRIFVNGDLLARSNIAAGACLSKTLCDSAVPLGWAILGGALAMIVLGFTPWRGKAASASAAIGAGVAVTLMAQRVQIGPAWADSHSWMPYLALVGAAVVAAAYVQAPQ